MPYARIALAFVELNVSQLVCFLNFNIDDLDIFEWLVIFVCLGLLYCDHYIISLGDLQPANGQVSFHVSYLAEDQLQEAHSTFLMLSMDHQMDSIRYHNNK